MLILHVIASMDPKYGGPSQGIRNLDAGEKDRDVVREVVCFDAGDSSYLGHDNFEIHALGKGAGVWNYSNKLIPWLNNNIQRFDVIIINGLWQYYSYATWKVMTGLRKQLPGIKLPKLFVMPHGMLDPYFQNAKSRRLKAIRNWTYWKLIEKNVVNDADGLLFTCQTELLLARETFKPYKPRKEYDVGYGIDTPPVFSDKMSNAFFELCPHFKGKPYLLFLSRIHPKKGINLLIDAYAALYESSDSKETLPKLVIAGPGLESNYGKLLRNKIAKKPELQNNICFTGMLTDDSKWGAFHACEAFVLPSHQENFGIAVAEALACGKPVLITNQVNIWREIIKEGGGIVEDDSKQGVKKMLQQWFNLTSSQKKQMSINAISTYKKYFAINSIVQNYTDAFVDKA